MAPNYLERRERYPEVLEMIWVGARPRDSTRAEYRTLRGSRFDLSWARIFRQPVFVRLWWASAVSESGLARLLERTHVETADAVVCPFAILT